MNAIVAISENWGIGRDHELLFRISSDMKRFRALTSGNTVVMSYNTLLSMPGQKALPERKNIIISPLRELTVENATVLHSADAFAQWLPEHDGDDVFLVGGASLYTQFLGHCKKVLVTKVFSPCKEPDCFFPNLDKMENWSIAASSPMMEEDGLRFQFIDYVNTAL